MWILDILYLIKYKVIKIKYEFYRFQLEQIIFKGKMVKLKKLYYMKKKWLKKRGLFVIMILREYYLWSI